MNDNIVDTPPEVREVEERPKGKARFHQNTYRTIEKPQSISKSRIKKTKKARTPAVLQYRVH
jgi:hypothetical protein